MRIHSIAKNLSCALVLAALAGCSTNKYAATNKIYKDQSRDFGKMISAFPPVNQPMDSLGTNPAFIGTTNFGIRKPNYVIIHHTAQDSLAQTIKTFTLTRTQTSSHYVIGRDGKVVQMANDYLRANHAGAGKWGSVTDMNSCSLGIEMDNNGTTDPWTNAQINSLCTLLGTLKKRYNIPTANFIGHADYAPGRKNDPKNFPWKILAKRGFGYWYDEVLKMPPATFNPKEALRIMGYNTNNMSGAIEAFKIHFVQVDISTKLTEIDKLILYNIYQKYL